MKGHNADKMALAERKPYGCRICDRRFATESSLNNHVARVRRGFPSCRF
jgi:hypothetical protein